MLTILSSDMGEALYSTTGVRLPVWIPYLIFYVMLTVVMLLLSVKKLRVNMKRG